MEEQKGVLGFIDGWKKIIAVVLLIAINAVGNSIGLDDEQIAEITKGLAIYLPSQGISDVGKYIAKYLAKKKEPQTVLVENLGELDPEKYKL
jgi:hypothetical protein